MQLNGNLYNALRVLLAVVFIVGVIVSLGVNWANTVKESDVQLIRDEVTDLETNQQLLEQRVEMQYQVIIEKLERIEKRLEGGK